MLTKEETLLNGVPVERLKETIQAIRRDPTLADFEFRASNRWLGGGRNRSTIKDFFGAGQEDPTRSEPFILDNDEPEVLLGKDQAPNPVEYLLHGLAGCVTTTLACHAAARGIAIESISSEIEGDIDIRGFLGLSDQVPRGFKTIRVRMKVKSDAPAEKLADLSRYSPVYNTVVNPVPVEIVIEKA
jgi:uncharacterized OsmC-like protein